MSLLRILAVLTLIVIAAQAVTAARGETTLLATSEPLKGGVTADLVLEIKPGTGKIFIESSPLTKLDTQISTRFAKEVACNHVGNSCANYDFFYTIKADAAIIGGPSAGAAMAALTVAVLEEEELNESVAVTGTINSGEIIGHVGGISEKIEAASDAGINKVLIPKGEVTSFTRNISIDAKDYGRELGVEVVEVFTLDEAMKEFTGKTFSPQENNIQVDERYTRVMQELAKGMCERTFEFENEFPAADYDEAGELAENLSRQGKEAIGKESYYAAASFCFGANVRYKYLELAEANLSEQQIKEGLEKLSADADKFESSLGNATTVSDAQVLAIVLDRIEEARQHINTSLAALEQEATERSVFELAFAAERLQSADAWNKFYNVISEKEITTDMLRRACVNKLAEAQERVEYSNILIMSASDGARARLATAQKAFDSKDYTQCLHKATLAKAEADTLLSVFGVKDEEITPIVERKLEAAKVTLTRQTKSEIFPIVGYSYYEYAGSLKESDKYSALLFSEYALEFSNLNIYFTNTTGEVTEIPKPGDGITVKRRVSGGVYFASGLLLGVGISALMNALKERKRKRILINKAKKSTAKRKR